jgi:hypothetical protein
MFGSVLATRYCYLQRAHISQNSPFDFVLLNLSISNSMASTGDNGFSTLRSCTEPANSQGPMRDRESDTDSPAATEASASFRWARFKTLGPLVRHSPCYSRNPRCPDDSRRTGSAGSRGRDRWVLLRVRQSPRDR